MLIFSLSLYSAETDWSRPPSSKILTILSTAE
jgi:hypothetical protein